MNTNQLKRFAREARIKLIDQIGAKLEKVLTTDSAELREKSGSIKQLQEAINATNKEQVIDTVAYTWFNRLVALRFMDVNGYEPIGIKVVSPHTGATLPELLQEAKAGNIPEDLKVNHQRIFDLLAGKIPAADAQTEAYRELLVGACNHLHTIFPFLFERINDYSELLLPDDLLSEFSIIEDIKNGMAAEDCEEVEILGWLYQFYISEKKDEVFASKSKVKKEDIPAATQLFTPRWIVEYMVQNTVGKLWLQNNPKSSLRDHMPYFIESASIAPSGEKVADQAHDYLKISSVEEITLLDQACGSGHILVYGFELLSKIYEEEGYNEGEIPKLIIEKNLYGFEIDQRAAQLAGLALMLKARSYHRRFFRKEVTPNILCYKDLQLTDDELKATFTKIDTELNDDLLNDLTNMQQATNLGSLIIPHSKPAEIEKTNEAVKKKLNTSDVFLKHNLIQIEEALKQLSLLGKKYHCIVDNPPYMGGGNMNKSLADFVKANYPDSKSDLMACFMEAGLAALHTKGFLGMINQHSWMFLSSYEKLREKLIANTFFDTLLHLGPRTFPEIGGEVVQNASFTFWNTNRNDKGSYIRLVDGGNTELKRTKTIEAIQNSNCDSFYTVNQNDFQKIPGSPIGYWMGKSGIESFSKFDALGKNSEVRTGLDSGNSMAFVRNWFEPALDRTTITLFSENKYWYPYNNGGGYRRWYGNNNLVVNWNNNGEDIHNYNNLPIDYNGAPVRAKRYYFKKGITYGKISSKGFTTRYSDSGFIFSSGGSTIFSKLNLNNILGFTCSKVAQYYLNVFNPTLNNQVGDILRLPIGDEYPEEIDSKVEVAISISKCEWNSRETSWDFQQNELLRIHNQDQSNTFNPSLEETYDSFCQYWQKKFFELHKNEEELNRQFIEIYGLEDELTPDVPLEDITILKDETEIANGELVFRGSEIIKQFVSYAVGCMFGRYSLDKPGLILANQGETLDDYIEKMVDGEVVNGGWCEVDSDEPKNKNHDKGLQGVADMATEYETGNSSVSTDEGDAEGGNIQFDRSDKTISRERAQQHSRRASKGDKGVSAFSADSKRFAIGAGNSTDDSGKSGNVKRGDDPTGDSGNSQHQKANEQSDEQTALTGHQPPNHQSPSTKHQAPTTFLPDDDNIIPILDNEWFEDDIVGRFYEFLKITFGKANFEKNLAFVEDALGKDIRKYFLRDFYTDHVKRYKKRPIYWMFSSPSGAFNALIYMHRYTPNTLNQILNGYLTAFREKLQAELNHQAHLKNEGTSREQTLAAKEENRIHKVLLELQEYEREVYKLATDRIEIDLDDGVLVNYNKFGEVIKEVSGLNDKKAKAKVRGFDWIDTTQIR